MSQLQIILTTEGFLKEIPQQSASPIGKEFKAALLAYQKYHGLPYGALNKLTLGMMGINY